MVYGSAYGFKNLQLKYALHIGNVLISACTFSEKGELSKHRKTKLSHLMTMGIL